MQKQNAVVMRIHVHVRDSKSMRWERVLEKLYNQLHVYNLVLYTVLTRVSAPLRVSATSPLLLDFA